MQKAQKSYRHSSDFFRKMSKLKVKVNNSGSISSSTNNPVSNDSYFEDECTLFPEVDVNIHNNSADLRAIVSPIIVSEINKNEATSSDAFENIVKEENQLIAINEKAKKRIRYWAVKNKLAHTTINQLLEILRTTSNLTHLPMDSRTLLQTPRKINNITTIGTGQVWYNSIKNNLELALNNLSLKELSHISILSLKFNIDGMSPFANSILEFWPILFLIEELTNMKPMVILLYYGKGKPPLEPFLNPFVDELNQILLEGIVVKNHKFQVKIKCFICDTPARSFLKGTPNFNAQNGACLKCTVVGEWDRRGRHMSYPRIDCPRRTDEDFRTQLDEDHHKQNTPLVRLPMDLIKGVPIADSLHLFDLGIMRKCLYAWCNGSYNYRTKMSALEIINLSTAFENTNEHRPSDIHRSVRTLNVLKYWKGTEFRTVLLYLGPVLLKEFLPLDVYQHFLMLSCAVTILMSRFYLRYITIAEHLLNDYINEYIILYGIDSITSNVHNLCHVTEDVENFGALPEISAYPFENFLGMLKQYLRSGRRPLSQIAKRIGEIAKMSTTVDLEKNPYPYVQFIKDGSNGTYRKVCIDKSFFISDDKRNKWFMTADLDIVEFRYTVFLNGNILVYGEPLRDRNLFFNLPFSSSHLNIYKSDIKKKML